MVNGFISRIVVVCDIFADTADKNPLPDSASRFSPVKAGIISGN
ncbi:MAG TPA: hypothetical protein VJ943_07580 [Desulfotignum sp.]|nr:hypothetical protein [Desulfotignum sp.]